MRRRWTLAVAFGLLLAAGAAFAVLGLRALRLEREEDERNDRRRAEAWLASNEAKIVEALEHPAWLASDIWRLVQPPVADPLADATPEDRVLFDEATFLERRRNDPASARRIFERLAGGAGEKLLALTSALAAGVLALRAGDEAIARSLLERAALAPPDLVGADAPIAAAALYHLALLDAHTPRALDHVNRLLDVCEDGRKLRGDEGTDWGDLIVATEEALSPIVSFRATETGDQLGLARDHAWEGRAALDSTGGRTVSLDFSTLLTRTNERLEARSSGHLWNLFRLDDGSRARPSVFPTHTPVGGDLRYLGEEFVYRRLPRPLEGYLVSLKPVPLASRGNLALLALGAGLLVYVLGAAVAIAAVRRSAKTAEMQADFVAAVSHEMKTPIAAVQAMSELLADGHVQDPERAKAYAERIRVDMQRLGATVRNVLDAARIERGGATLVDPRPGDPAGVVEHIAEAVRPILEGRGFRFDVDARPALRAVPMDADALTSVLGNLLDNAAKFSGERREVTLKAGPRPGGFRIEVLDRGPGVPARDRDRVFERFYRGEAAKRGAVPGIGLGLHVARELVEAHGGSLHVEDREGGGAAFVVDLPGSAA